MNERMSILSYSRFQSNARQDEGVIFLLTSLTMEKLRIFFCFVLYSLPEKKQVLTNIVLRRILTVFVKITKLSTVFPNIPLQNADVMTSCLFSI